MRRMKRHPTLRLVVGLGAALTALVLAGGLARPAAQSDRRPAAPQVDPKAVAVLQAMDEAFTRAEGLVATYRSEIFRPNGQPGGVETTTLRLGRPNAYYVESESGRAARQILASDGTTRFSVASGKPARCTTSAVAPLNDAREVDTFNPLYWSFYNLGEWQIRSAQLGHWETKWRLTDPGLRGVRYVGRESLDGASVDVVEWTYTIGYNRPEDDPIYTSRLAIGPDHFARRIETTSTSKNEYEGRRIIETVSDIRTTPRTAKQEFAYSPPEGAQCRSVNPEDAYTTGKFTDLPVGSKAPDFTLKTSRGESIRLSAFLAKHKVVLMNYWGYG
jgi:outer membrane lipoprotein-sorting protein